MLAAEIGSRTCPTETSVIMEDSPGELRSTFDTVPAVKLGAKTRSAETDSQVSTDRIDAIQAHVQEKFDHVADQLQTGQAQQIHLASTADALVASLHTALTALNLSQQQHEVVIQNNEQQLNAILKSNEEMMANNIDLGQFSRNRLQALAVQEARQINLSHQSANMQQHQLTQHQQMDAHEQATLKMQQGLAQMRGGTGIDRHYRRKPRPLRCH